MGQYLAKTVRRHAKDYYALHPQARRMCNGCAFKEGADANREDVVFDALECLVAPNGRFMCHETCRIKFEDGSLLEPTQVCAGFQISRWVESREDVPAPQEGGEQ